MLTVNVTSFTSSSALHAIVVPGMGGSYLYQGKKRIWPSPFPQDIRSMCSNHTIDTLEVGNIDGILTGDWMSRALLGNRFYQPLIDSLPAPVHGFPYDFRRIMDESYLSTLYDRFEFFLNQSPSDRRYVLYCHSLGGLLMHDFLSSRPAASARIHTIVYINCPFDGSVMPLAYLMKGITASLPIPISLLPSRECLLRFGGFFWCLPWTDPDRSVLSSPDLQVKDLFPQHPDYHQFLVPRKQYRYRDIPSLRSVLLYSRASSTYTAFSLNNPIHHVTSPDGDGVVSNESLTLPLRSWSIVPASKEFPGTDHSSILSDPIFLQECTRILFQTK